MVTAIVIPTEATVEVILVMGAAIVTTVSATIIMEVATATTVEAVTN